MASLARPPVNELMMMHLKACQVKDRIMVAQRCQPFGGSQRDVLCRALRRRQRVRAHPVAVLLYDGYAAHVAP